MVEFLFEEVVVLRLMTGSSRFGLRRQAWIASFVRDSDALCFMQDGVAQASKRDSDDTLLRTKSVSAWMGTPLIHLLASKYW